MMLIRVFSLGNHAVSGKKLKGQLTDQAVTVYVQQRAMNGVTPNGGKIVALSKQLQSEYKQYLHQAIL